MKKISVELNQEQIDFLNKKFKGDLSGLLADTKIDLCCCIIAAERGLRGAKEEPVRKPQQDEDEISLGSRRPGDS